MRADLRSQGTAAQYDEYTAHFVDVFDSILVERVKQEAPGNGDPGVLLDVGTGTARVLVRLAGEPELDHLSLIGVDLYEDMVSQARLTIREMGLEGRIRVDQGDVHDLPYETESVDIVISRSTIHHWRDPVLALKEVFRVLSPGGVAVIHEVRRNPPEEELEVFNRQRARAGLGPTVLEEKYTPEEVVDFLQQAGLEDRYSIVAPSSGPGAMGFELRLQK